MRGIREDGPSPKEETAPEVVMEPTNKESLEKEFIDALRKFTAEVNNDEVQSKLIETQKDITETLRQISVTLGAPKCMMFQQKHPVIFEYYPFAASDVPADPTNPPRPLMQVVGSVQTGVQVGTPAKEVSKGGSSKTNKHNQHHNDGRVSTSGSKRSRAEGDEDAGEKPEVKKKSSMVGGVKPDGKNGSKVNWVYQWLRQMNACPNSGIFLSLSLKFQGHLYF